MGGLDFTQATPGLVRSSVYFVGRAWAHRSKKVGVFIMAQAAQIQ